MRFHTREEQGRRLLAWAGLIGAGLYGATCARELLTAGHSTAWWPVVLFWAAIVTAAVGVLIRPRHYTHVDLGSRVVRIIRNGSVTRELPLSQLAPLEVHEFVPVKETNFSVRYGVRSRPFPDVQFGDDAVQSKALRRLATVGERLGLSTTAAVVSSADLTPDGEAKWIESDPV